MFVSTSLINRFPNVLKNQNEPFVQITNHLSHSEVNSSCRSLKESVIETSFKSYNSIDEERILRKLSP